MLLKRSRLTKPQSLYKDYSDREKNIKNAFKLVKNINAKKILLVDDVLTSGSTLIEISKLFPTQEIYIYTLSIAV